MWFWILKNIILSILLIISLQYLVKYLKETFTIRKIKDNNCQIEKYKTILNEFQEQINKKPTIQKLSDDDIQTLDEDLSTFLTQIHN